MSEQDIGPRPNDAESYVEEPTVVLAVESKPEPATVYGRLNSTKAFNGDSKCICPRAQVVRDEFYENRKKQSESKSSGFSLRGTVAAPSEARKVNNMLDNRPNFTKGACFTEYGRKVNDIVLTRKEGWPIALRTLRWMCNRRCEIRAECEAWIKKAEKPAGSINGVYAGMTAQERRVANA